MDYLIDVKFSACLIDVCFMDFYLYNNIVDDFETTMETDTVLIKDNNLIYLRKKKKKKK